MNELTTYLSYDDVLILPSYSDINKSDVDLSNQLFKDIELKLPIVASPMDTVCEDKMASAIASLGGVGIIHRNQSIDKQINQIKRVCSKGFLVGGAVGVGKDSKIRIQEIYSAGAKFICIDYSVGHSKKVCEMTSYIKEKFSDLKIIAGNVITYEGAKDLFLAGADVIRVGKGAGSICISRKLNGIGSPQFSAIIETSKAAKEFGGKIIADGGVKNPSDIAKALAAGADFVMLGSFLAGTDESPGKLKEIDGHKYKYYRGMGSVKAMQKGSADRYDQDEKLNNNLTPEGVESYVKYTGSMDDRIETIKDGLLGSFMNVGASSIDEFRKKARFIRITNSGNHESSVHSVKLFN